MSSLIVEVTPILEISPHPNADAMELAKIKGWTCCVKKDIFKPGDLVVYIPIDSVLPVELSDRLGVTKYLSKGRVRTAKLRGTYSQGLIAPVDILPEPAQEGDNVAEVLGITKFEPDLPVHMGGYQRKHHPRFERYTNIEHYRNYPHIFDGLEVVITEKLHGTNFRAGMLDGELHVGSHNCNYGEDERNLYWQAANLYPLRDVLSEGEILFGEVVGPKVQQLHYGLKRREIRFFDLMRDGYYVSWAEFLSFCLDNKLPIAPVLKFPSLWDERLLQLADGKSVMSGAGHIKEGIVIKPIIEKADPAIGRVIAKHISEKYLMKDYGDAH